MLVTDVAEPRCSDSGVGTSIDLLGLDEKEDDGEKVWGNWDRGEKRISPDETDGVTFSDLSIYCDVRTHKDREDDGGFDGNTVFARWRIRPSGDFMSNAKLSDLSPLLLSTHVCSLFCETTSTHSAMVFP